MSEWLAEVEVSHHQDRKVRLLHRKDPLLLLRGTTAAARTAEAATNPAANPTGAATNQTEAVSPVGAMMAAVRVAAMRVVTAEATEVVTEVETAGATEATEAATGCRNCCNRHPC